MKPRLAGVLALFFSFFILSPHSIAVELLVLTPPPLCYFCFAVFYAYPQAHFEESMAHSRKSVSEEELARYESFSTNMKSDRGFEEFSFDDKEGGANDADAPDADDVDDLYG